MKCKANAHVIRTSAPTICLVFLTSKQRTHPLSPWEAAPRQTKLEITLRACSSSAHDSFIHRRACTVLPSLVRHPRWTACRAPRPALSVGTPCICPGMRRPPRPRPRACSYALASRATYFLRRVRGTRDATLSAAQNAQPAGQGAQIAQTESCFAATQSALVHVWESWPQKEIV